MQREAFPKLAPIYRDLPLMLGELRSDHAGEVAAVMMYRGILAVSRDALVRRFAYQHLATEKGHVVLLEVLGASRSRLLWLWRVAGYLVGALPGLAGARAVFAAIESVERFVDTYYARQIEMLDSEGAQGKLRALLLECQGEEVEHRDEAAAALGPVRGLRLRLWGAFVSVGCRIVVTLARQI